MHEDIMKFPSQWFYNGELQAAPEIRYRGILDWDTPINWIDTSDMDFKEEFIGETFGRINKAEADLLLQELKAYINRIGGKRVLEERIDFGIISPYKAQVQYLRNKIKASGSLKPYRSLLTVNTVDGFQGQERDVIFISLGPCQRRWSDRLPQRPAKNECGHNPCPHEAGDIRRSRHFSAIILFITGFLEYAGTVKPQDESPHED